MKPLRPCAAVGCPALVKQGRCPRHEAQAKREDVARRGTARARGYDSAWARLRASVLAECPRCEECGSAERLDVHHRVPVRVRPDLRLERGNCVVLCHRHHMRTHATMSAGRQ
jgi:5-methylcytosine-specific restriction endonuclease McrA